MQPLEQGIRGDALLWQGALQGAVGTSPLPTGEWRRREPLGEEGRAFDWDLGQSPHSTGEPIQTLHILKIDLLFKQKHKIDLS